MKRSTKGSKNERRSKLLLELEGYAVTRAAASLGVFDLVAIGASDIVLCQVKSNRWPSADELAEVRDFDAPANARKLVHRWRDRACAPDVMVVK